METLEYSIIVPVYNAESVLSRCIDSILNQTITNFELILVDDGSKDRSFEICNRYQKMDSRVIALTKKNGGVSSARNLGLKTAKGKYIAFVDSDDYVDNTYLENLDVGDGELIISGVKYEGYGVCGELTTKWNSRVVSMDEKEQLIELLLGKELSYVVAKRYRKELIDKEKLLFDESLTLGEDGYFNICYIEKCTKIHLVENIDYIYVRYNRETLSNCNLNKETIIRFENVNKKIREKMYEILGTEANKIMQIRVAAFYDTMIFGKIMDEKEKIKYPFIRFLFQQQEFKYTLNNVDQNYPKESKKFRMILKTKSAFVFWGFIKLLYIL